MRIEGNDYKIVEKAEEVTGTTSDIVWLNKEEKSGYWFGESMFSMIEELLMEIDRLKEVNEDLIQDRDENYEPKKFNPYNEYGISEDNFH